MFCIRERKEVMNLNKKLVAIVFGVVACLMSSFLGIAEECADDWKSEKTSFFEEWKERVERDKDCIVKDLADADLKQGARAVLEKKQAVYVKAGQICEQGFAAVKAGNRKAARDAHRVLCMMGDEIEMCHFEMGMFWEKENLEQVAKNLAGDPKIKGILQDADKLWKKQSELRAAQFKLNQEVAEGEKSLENIKRQIRLCELEKERKDLEGQ